MKLIITPFVADDLKELSLQPAQEFLVPFIERPGYGRELQEAGPCYTGRLDGRIMVCAGVVNLWEGRASAWALLAHDAGKCMRQIHRAVEDFLDACGITRVEAYVYPDFMQGRRWAKMLGFEHEGLMRHFQQGADMCMYARIR